MNRIAIFSVYDPNGHAGGYIYAYPVLKSIEKGNRSYPILGNLEIMKKKVIIFGAGR